MSTQPVPHGIMIDIETLDTRASAVVLSVAALKFQLFEDGVVLLGDQLWTPRLREQLAAGRTTSDKTIKWWGDQPQEARDHWANPQTSVVHVYQMLDQLKTFCGSDIPVWANGAVFDVGILESLCAQFGCDIPWRYNMVRDARTIYHDLRQRRDRHESPNWKDGLFVAHDPVHDCVNQTWRLWEHRVELDKRPASPTLVEQAVAAAPIDYTGHPWPPAGEPASSDTGE